MIEKKNIKKINLKKKVIDLDTKGFYVNKQKYYGGIILDEHYYGKCILPNSRIIVKNIEEVEKVGKEIDMEYLWNNYVYKQSCIESNDKLGEWYYLNDDIYIKSYNQILRLYEYNQIVKVYKQEIKELVRNIKLCNGFEITTTMNHKFLKLVNGKIVWSNKLDIGDLIYTTESEFSEIIIMNIWEYSGYVYDLSVNNVRNYFANNILCHNTSENILTPLLLKNKNLIISSYSKFDNWHKNITITVIKNKNDLTKLKHNLNKNLSFLISYKFLLDNYENEELRIFFKNTKFNRLIMEIDYEDLKKKNRDLLLSLDLKYKKKWLVVNELPKLKKNINFINNLYFNKSNYSENIYLKYKNKFVIKNDIIIKNKYKINNRFLEFSNQEINNYRNYLNKYCEIYENNNILFESDEYLRKYCCYPQKNIKINYFRNNSDNDILKKKYFMEDMDNICKNNKISCMICLNNINLENLGITDCGHIYCYSCIYKSICINPKCPKCRNDINKEQIYLYDIDSKRQNIESNLDNKNNQGNKNTTRKSIMENIKRSRSNKYRYNLEFNNDFIDMLGTKISYLIKLVRNLKECIVFSNFSDNLVNISNILNQLNVNNIILENNKKNINIRNTIILSTYDFRLDNILGIRNIIFNDPYYSNNNKNSNLGIYSNIINTFNKNDINMLNIYNLIMKNTIEENIFSKNNNVLSDFSNN